MQGYVDSALYIYSEDSQSYVDPVLNNPFGVQINAISINAFMDDQDALLDGVDHVVVSGKLEVIKRILRLAMQYGFSVGLLATPDQKSLRKGYGLPDNVDAAMDLALQKDAQDMDIILCNRQILLIKATIGRLPLLDSPHDIGPVRLAVQALKKFAGLKLLTFSFTTSGDKKIETAACGCMIIQHHERSLASSLIAHDSSFTDEMIPLVISAPRSIMDYLKFLGQAIRGAVQHKRVPQTVGYIKSSRINIETEKELNVFIDNEQVTQTPLQCETIPKAVRINVGESLREKSISTKPVTEKINIDNLPAGKELLTAREKKIPFFSYASEERFRDLFVALREDARINPVYLVLMVLSTMLATVGLYLSSSSVVIGAMLLAPLMAPIISLAMGLLRRDEGLIKKSAIKVAVGMVIALLAATLITLLFPHKPLTPEMEARLNPTVLDLAVAIIAGIAGAYTKSFKEIMQSLAGVAIAVALVPPLAAAGIGLGRGDLFFFAQAFLLFSTNLIGIIFAATFTFRVLGYSAAVRSKRGLGIVAVVLVMISIPLYMSYHRIVEKMVFERSWKQERFLVNNKYLIIKKAKLVFINNKEVLTMDVLAREPLDRSDLNQLKRKVQTHFSRDLVFRANIIYIP
jgi:uncharacterized hydrophobic protein (TIGR00271 family)